MDFDSRLALLWLFYLSVKLFGENFSTRGLRSNSIAYDAQVLCSVETG